MKLTLALLGAVWGSVLPKDPVEYIRGMADGGKNRDDVYFEYLAKFGRDSMTWEKFVNIWHQATSWSEDEALGWINGFVLKNPNVSQEDTYEAFDEKFGPTPKDVFLRLWRRSRLEHRERSPSKDRDSPLHRSRSPKRPSVGNRRREIIRENFDHRLTGIELFNKVSDQMKKEGVWIPYNSFLNDVSVVRKEKGYGRQYVWKPLDQKKWIWEQLESKGARQVYHMFQEEFGEEGMTKHDFDMCVREYYTSHSYKRSSDGSKVEKKALKK